MILDYAENRIATVQELSAGVWKAEAAVVDTLIHARISLEIRLPELTIADVTLDVLRSSLPFPDISGKLERLKGVRVAPGMTKIVNGLVGGEGGSDTVANLIFEAMEALILAYTAREFKTKGFKDVMPGPPVGEGKVQRNPWLIGPKGVVEMTKQNPRLANSCIAFLEDSE